jgi:indole-3-glycerol phosphate synthase
MPFFHGTLDDLRRVRAAVSIPVLRKDFILDRYQVLEAREAGADAVLLIAEILDDEQLQRLSAEILRWGMTPLVELYDAENVDRVVHSGAKLIGINNRDLRSFVTRLEHTVELASRIPKDRCLVSESGIRTRADVEMVRRAGAKAILVGETLMRAENLAEKMAELACP